MNHKEYYSNSNCEMHFLWDKENRDFYSWETSKIAEQLKGLKHMFNFAVNTGSSPQIEFDPSD